MSPADIFTWSSLAALLSGFIAIFLLVVFRLLAPGSLTGLVSEPGDGGKASLSRFQLLLFTYVIGGLLLVLSLQNGTIVPIDPTVLGLLGISGGSFLVSKGIGASQGNTQGPGGEPNPPGPVPAPAPSPAPGPTYAGPTMYTGPHPPTSSPVPGPAYGGPTMYTGPQPGSLSGV